MSFHFVQICNSLKFQLKSGVRQLMTLLEMKIFVKKSVTLFIAIDNSESRLREVATSAD